MKRTISILAALALASCSMESAPAPQFPKDEATFVVSAAPQSHHDTRAITEGGEHDNAVEEVTVLLFDAATEKYLDFFRPSALQKVAGSENLWKFAATLPQGSYKAVFMANAAAVIDAVCDIDVGLVRQNGRAMTELTANEIEYMFYRVIGSKYNAEPGSAGYVPFVMSSGREDVSVPFDTFDKYEKDPVKLARDVAKINVRFASGQARDRLAISEIRLCNYGMVSYTVPDASLWSNRNDPSKILFDPAVARPAAVIINGYDEYTSIVYRAADGEIPGGECVDRIFTPERPWAQADNMFLLVRGDVRIGGETRQGRWFKLAMMRQGRDVNILRNHVYTINITDVSDWGYASEAEAAAALPGNLTVDLEAREEGLDNIVYNGQYYLAVNDIDYEFSCIAELEQALDIHTDYPDGWRITPPAGGWPSWAVSTPSQAGSGGQTALNSIGLNANVADAERSFSFTIDAGPLRQRITVRQNPNFYTFATPGVVGIRLSDYRNLTRERIRRGDPAWLDPNIRLSVKGSSTYAGTVVDNAAARADFGGALEGEPVYAVYTMFGSTVAVLMGAGEAWADDGRRVVWANPGYRGATTGPWEGGSLTAASVKSDNTDYDIRDNLAMGHGDICAVISAGALRTPRGNPWQPDDGSRPFGSSEVSASGWWTGAMIADRNLTIFLPAAGYVESNGTNGTMGRDVQYRTTTAAGGSNGYLLAASSHSLAPSGNAPTRRGLPVRCVKDIPTVTPPPPPPPTPTLTVTPNPVRLDHKAGSQAAIVVTTNQSDWAVSARPSWIDVNTSTGAITANEANNATTERSGQLTITAGQAAPVAITVIQAARPFVPYPDVDPALLAPPGVLGVSESGELTLRGSREYEGTDIASNAGFGAVHEETVYIVLYKFGSNVAIPIQGSVNWSGISPSNTNGWPNDPCPYATVNPQGGKDAGAHVPSIVNNYWNGMSGLTPGGNVRLKNGKTVQGRYSTDWKMFLPYTKTRMYNGLINNTYWSSSSHDSQGSRYLMISPSTTRVMVVASEIAAPVRCVR